MSSLTRRHLLAGVGAAAAWSGPARAETFCTDLGVPTHRARDDTADPGLGDANARVDWGVAIESPAVDDARLLRALQGEAPKFIAVASGLKFGFLYPTQADIEPTAGVATGQWKECDDVVALAARLGVPVRGDCLAWNDWQPSWMTQLAGEKPDGWQALMRGYFETHVTDVFAHFKRLARGGGPQMRWCGLVNEPFNPWYRSGAEAAWRTGVWLDAFGAAPDGVPAYIHKAFTLGARHRGKGTTLFLNEANCENDHFGPLVRPAMLKLVDALQRAGRSIDAVGLECHLMPQWMDDPAKPDWRPFVAFLRDLARRGVRILLTELDVVDCAVRGMAARDTLVADMMASLVTAALDVPAVEMVTNWDFSDKYSWLRGDGVYPALGRWASCVPQPPCPRPDLYDADMRPKPARAALAKALAAAGH